MRFQRALYNAAMSSGTRDEALLEGGGLLPATLEQPATCYYYLSVYSIK